MIIETGTLTRTSLAGQVAIVTGAGRGIGFETAGALIWLGAKVVIAEIDSQTGAVAEKQLTDAFESRSAYFVKTDVGRERDVARLKRRVLKRYGQVDIVINNATVTPMGAVQDVAIAAWDASYRVNLRGPVLLARAFLPDMLARDTGVFVCVSSVGEAFMGAYESFKAAQVHLANTLDAELEDTGVCAFTIGPGLVHTPGANAGIEQLGPLYGKTVEEFYAISEAHVMSAEAAGAGFAAAVALAANFRGQEISAKQALIAAGIDIGEENTVSRRTLSPEQRTQSVTLCRQTHRTLKEQSDDWLERSLFERQWMLRDFKKNAGMPVEQWLDALTELEDTLAHPEPSATAAMPPLHKLEGYYAHMQTLASGYEKDPDKLAKQLRTIQSWRDEINQLIAMLDG